MGKYRPYDGVLETPLSQPRDRRGLQQPDAMGSGQGLRDITPVDRAVGKLVNPLRLGRRHRF